MSTRGRAGRSREGGSEGDLHVLVVDDSAVVRQFFLSLLSHRARTTVATARDPLVAERRIAERRPDVIVLDLEMPRMDGMSFLRQLMATDPIPVVICSSRAGRGRETGLDALREGAVEIISKPKIGLRSFLEDSMVQITDAIVAAAQAKVRARPAPRQVTHAAAQQPVARLPPVLRSAPSSVSIIAIGASTGGPEAIETVLLQLPPTCPSLLIVQHMPAPFVSLFANRLAQRCALEVREARDGDAVIPGRALVAPGDRHLVVRYGSRGLQVSLESGPLVSRHRPSVDVLFKSVADHTGPKAIGVILTGMGNDGVDGLVRLRAVGAHTIAQDESSSTVYGMPKAAIDRGVVDQVLPLDSIPAALLEQMVEARSPAASFTRLGGAAE